MSFCPKKTKKKQKLRNLNKQFQELRNKVVENMARTKGSLNRRTVDIWELLHKHGFNPMERMILFAKGDAVALGYDSTVYIREAKDGSGSTTLAYVIPPQLSADMTEKLCNFIYPKRKAVELSGSISPELAEAAEKIKSMSKEEQIKLLEAQLKDLKK